MGKSLPAVLTVLETARMLRISRTLAYEGIARGEIPSVRIGRRILVPTHRLVLELLGEGEKDQLDV